MLYLTRPNDRPAARPDYRTPIDETVGLLREAGIPHARVRRTGTEESTRRANDEFEKDDVTVIRSVLREARDELIRSNGHFKRQLRFPLFSLAYLLMDSPSGDDGSRPLLRQSDVMRNIDKAVRTLDREVASVWIKWKLPLWAMYIVTLGFFRVVLTGRVPVLSGKYRWFMRQPHLAPDLSGTFVRFARRLTDWKEENPEYVARLLVNAFLEDLRRNYRFPWRNARRMTYPVLLLDDDAMARGGGKLLWLVNEIRNQTGLFDPLLIVAAGRPEHVEPVPHDSWPTTENSAAQAYRVWQDALSMYRRKREPITWYLPLSIPVGREGVTTFRPETIAERKAVRPPLVFDLTLRVILVVLIVAAGAGVSIRYDYDHCWNWTPAHWSWSPRATVSRTGSECIGVSDGSLDLFQPSDSTIGQVENTIVAQNERAANMHGEFPRRPYITVVDLQATTSSDGTSDGLTAEREGMEGVATAQERQLNESGDADPIVRVLVADGGAGMRRASTVAKQLGGLANRDKSLVGVVGLDMSSQPTLDMVGVLSSVGLPMVASTLSQQNLATGHPMYFQVAPTDDAEARVVAAFADHQANSSPRIPRTVRIYYSDDASDTYSADLRDAARTAFSAKGFSVTPEAFTPGKANSAGQDTCGFDGFVYFAGRGVPDYGDFLSGASQCSSTAVFIGDDDVSRYVADAAKRRANQALNFYYVSFASAPPIRDRHGAELDFYQTLDHLFPFETHPDRGRSLDGHAALAYDAAQVVITAASYLRAGSVEHPITPGTVWREITDIHGSPTQHHQIDGVSGTIDYGGDITRQVPLNKPLAILQVVHGDVDPDILGFCGTAAGHTPSQWCP
ncbi:hypothetical protein [Nocardia alni]|uniref:hypothetical protein n=1 Tax=Nocardia alni TaxID=2815723 RepID=UPI001C222DBB|nr:hypothetical protein [Nocardia alni]